jgi:hypothetical protein
MTENRPVTLFLDELDRLLDALYIVGLAGLESAHRADLARLQVEATQLGLDGAARLLHRLQQAAEPTTLWPPLQNLRTWAVQFRRRYSLASLDLTPPSRARLKAPLPFETVEFLELVVLGTYPLTTSRLLLYCLDLRSRQTVIIEDVVFVPGVGGWSNVQSLLFGSELDYPPFLAQRFFLRHLKKGEIKDGPEILLPTLATTFEQLEPVDRLSLWGEAQANGPLRARSPEEAFAFTFYTPNALKILDRRVGEGYEARLLLAPNPQPKPRRLPDDWKPYLAIAAAFRHPDLDRPRLYSLLTIDRVS